MQKSPRLRAFFLLCGLSAAVLMTAVAYSVGPTAVEATLRDALPPERIDAAAESLRNAILASFLACLLLVVPVSLWIGGFAQRPVLALRRAVGRNGELRSRWGVAEVDVLAATCARVIREHERTAEVMTRERDELAFLIDSVGEGILQIGPEGRLIRANHTAREMLALPERLERQPVSTLIRHAELRTLLGATHDGRRLDPAEVNLDGRRILVVTRPIGMEGEGLGAVVVLVDLTDLHRLESVRRDFVANASHELKTPLTSIRGYAETLLGDDAMPEETRRQFLETIQRNAERLQSIVEDLLDLSRLESGGWRPDLEELDVAGVAEKVWNSVAEKAAAKQIAFEVDGDDAPQALADPVAVRQILANLLDNAIRYSRPNGRIMVRVTLAASMPLPNPATPTAGAHPALRAGHRGGAVEAGGRWVVVEVVDTGSGIPRDALPRVFERFYRVDPARSREEGGTGLGLAIVKHLVESMGGDVVAESALGRGTTFRFRLPAAQPAALQPEPKASARATA